MKELTLAQKSQLDNNKRIKKLENREKVSVVGQTTLNNTENIEETNLKSFDEKKGKKFVGKTKEGRLTGIFLSETNLEKRPKSSEFPRRTEFLEKIDSAIRKKKIFDDKNFCCCCCCCCWRMPRRECSSFLNLDSRSWSGCVADTLDKGQSEPWDSFNLSSRPRRKCRSNPNVSKTISKKIFDGEREFHKVKRSLRLLGFELSDFGLDSGWDENLPKKKADEKSASFSTKITSRSISLDSLRAAVKRAWIDDRLDESHRKLLAQAAYEEWYFKKEKELWIKRNEEKLTRLKAKENLRDHFERKKEKSQEEFQKWLNEKTTKRKKNEKNLAQNQENPSNGLFKTKEECEKAFLKWKKTKEEELEKKKKEKEREEERRKKLETEKSEKKIMAEKAFQLWTTKLKETKSSKEAKKQRQKKRQEMQERRKRKKGPQISFEMWKAVKDEQIKEKTKHNRVACKIAREERLAQMEERMYEAEQAFEDWLEKVETRKQKGFAVMNDYNKTIPWIPA